MNGASQLHAALDGRLDRISEVLVRIEHHPQVDKRKVARESFARSLKALDPKRPIREADMPRYSTDNFLLLGILSIRILASRRSMERHNYAPHWLCARFDERSKS